MEREYRYIQRKQSDVGKPSYLIGTSTSLLCSIWAAAPQNLPRVETRGGHFRQIKKRKPEKRRYFDNENRIKPVFLPGFIKADSHGARKKTEQDFPFIMVLKPTQPMGDIIWYLVVVVLTLPL